MLSHFTKYALFLLPFPLSVHITLSFLSVLLTWTSAVLREAPFCELRRSGAACAILASSRRWGTLAARKSAVASAGAAHPWSARCFFCAENKVKHSFGRHRAQGAPWHVALHRSLHRIYHIFEKSNFRYLIRELNYSNVH